MMESKSERETARMNCIDLMRMCFNGLSSICCGFAVVRLPFVSCVNMVECFVVDGVLFFGKWLMRYALASNVLNLCFGNFEYLCI